MQWSLAIVVCAFAFALAMFTPSKASAGGYYSGYSYGCCCVTYCYGSVRSRGFNRRYAYPRYDYGRGGPRYSYGRGGYPRARSYARRGARRW